MNKGKNELSGKVNFIVKAVVLWMIVFGMAVISECSKENISIYLLISDWKQGFVDNMELGCALRQDILISFVLFLLFLTAGLCTKELVWQVHVYKWQWSFKTEDGSIGKVINGVLLALLVVFAFVTTFFAGPVISGFFEEDWNRDSLIAHACGGIEENNYTNSREAFEASYALGMRSIEVDFILTADDKLVCCHGWEDELSSEYGSEYVYTKDEFLNTRIYDKYTSLALEDVFELMKKYTDVWIITDTKETEEELVRKEFEEILKTAEETDSMDVLDRMVVQLYSYEMYDIIEEIYPFPEYILTLYQMEQPGVEDFVEHCRFCKNRGIDTITMRQGWVRQQFAGIAERYGINMYVHTVNTMDRVEDLQELGVKGFYTDFLEPDMMTEQMNEQTAE